MGLLDLQFGYELIGNFIQLKIHFWKNLPQTGHRGFATQGLNVRPNEPMDNFSNPVQINIFC
jgi:hypothetical protein